MGVPQQAGGVKGGGHGGVREKARPPRAPRACQACGGSAGCSRGPQACPGTPAAFGTAPTPPPYFLPPTPPPATQGAQEGVFVAGGGQVAWHGGVLSSPCTPKGCCWEPVSVPPLAGSPRVSPPRAPQGARLWLSSRQRAQPLLIDSFPINCCSLPACPCGRACLAQQPPGRHGANWESCNDPPTPPQADPELPQGAQGTEGTATASAAPAPRASEGGKNKEKAEQKEERERERWKGR